MQYCINAAKAQKKKRVRSKCADCKKLVSLLERKPTLLPSIFPDVGEQKKEIIEISRKSCIAMRGAAGWSISSENASANKCTRLAPTNHETFSPPAYAAFAGVGAIRASASDEEGLWTRFMRILSIGSFIVILSRFPAKNWKENSFVVYGYQSSAPPNHYYVMIFLRQLLLMQSMNDF